MAYNMEAVLLFASDEYRIQQRMYGRYKRFYNSVDGGEKEVSNIIKIEGYEFEKKDKFLYSRLHNDRCAHRKITLDDQGQTVHCSDCGDQLSAYWALNEVLSCYKRKMAELGNENSKVKSIREDLQKEYRFLKVLKDIQRAWRGKNKMAVCCPWCGVGIMPEDGLGDITMVPHIDLNRTRLLKERKNERKNNL